MKQRLDEFVICGFILTTLLLIHYFSDITRFLFGGFYSPENVSVLIQTQAKEYSWFLKLLLNCFGYSCVILPGYFVIKYVQVNNYLEKNDGSTCIYRLVSLCIKGTSHGGGIQDPESVDLLSSNGKDGGTGISPRKETSGPSSAVLKSQSTSRECLKLTWCFSGLMMSYLTWGVLQEKIMTQKYYNYGNGQYSYFTNSQYLVFVNRLLAFLMSLCALQYHRLAMGRHRAPLYKYSYASLSNIMSAWFQYEALKYVNFPTQVLAKSCKIIPVMLMGRLVSRKRYEYYEYFTAFLISLGMGMFMIGSAEGKNREYTNSAGTLTATGLLLLSMYMIFDSFTANWQDNLFREYRMTPLQMMCGVNLFSTLFTAASLNLQSGFMESFQFIVQHPKFIFDILILSISSAIGQLFIFYTISVFGAVVFTIIMTLRQAFAILLSCLIYKHEISVLGILGIVNVFVAIFLRIYCNQRVKAKRLKLDAHRPKQAV